MVDVRGRRQRRSQRRKGEASPPSFERISIIVQHALLPLDEVRRIYVAFGEHPAAGGLYMSFWSLWHSAGPCGVSLPLWVALGLHCGTLGFHFDTHGVQSGGFWALWGDLGTLFQDPWAPFGYMCGHQ